MGSPFQKSLLCRRKKAARKRLLLAIAVLLYVEADRRGGKRAQPVCPAVGNAELQLRRVRKIRLPVCAGRKRRLCQSGRIQLRRSRTGSSVRR